MDGAGRKFEKKSDTDVQIRFGGIYLGLSMVLSGMQSAIKMCKDMWDKDYVKIGDLYRMRKCI